ncbi:hypothetical protein EVA_07281, partial [gut metagenome]
PRQENSICYVDGDVSEWTEADLVAEQDGLSVSMKYDEKFLYFAFTRRAEVWGGGHLSSYRHHAKDRQQLL